MIRPLRKRHRSMILFVALVVGSLLIAALLVRRRVPVMAPDRDGPSPSELVVRAAAPPAEPRR